MAMEPVGSGPSRSDGGRAGSALERTEGWVKDLEATLSRGPLTPAQATQYRALFRNQLALLSEHLRAPTTSLQAGPKLEALLTRLDRAAEASGLQIDVAPALRELAAALRSRGPLTEAAEKPKGGAFVPKSAQELRRSAEQKRRQETSQGAAAQWNDKSKRLGAEQMGELLDEDPDKLPAEIRARRGGATFRNRLDGD